MMGEIVSKKSINEFEAMLLQLPQVDLPITHTLSGGMYARTMSIPAGVAVTGATHKKDHLCVIVGDISATTDNGVERLTGYNVIAAKAGIKRAVFTHSDTTWTTICKTDLVCIEDIEEELVEESDRLMTRKALSGPREIKKIEE